MVGAVVITHGTLAASLLKTSKAIAGKVDKVRTIAVKSGSTAEEVRDELYEGIKAVGGADGVIIFTDMFGGTPTNIALSLLEEGVVEVLTGVNLPMLLKFFSLRKTEKAKELALKLKQYSRETIVLASDMLKSSK